MMVIFLCGLVALILLRTLRNDFARYAKEGDGFDLEGGIQQMGEDSGWKQVKH
jgi:transmembrane 9 superfamily protein 3